MFASGRLQWVAISCYHCAEESSSSSSSPSSSSTSFSSSAVQTWRLSCSVILHGDCPFVLRFAHSARAPLSAKHNKSYLFKINRTSSVSKSLRRGLRAIIIELCSHRETPFPSACCKFILRFSVAYFAAKGGKRTTVMRG